MNRNASSPLIEQLKPDAAEACAHAHAPYSHFPVGAALIARSGEIYSGCNVENSSFGLTICAERNALAQAIACGVRPGDVTGVLIYTPGAVAHAPCGACRQVMHELLSDDALVVSCCDEEAIRTWALADLMPEPFEF